MASFSKIHAMGVSVSEVLKYVNWRATKILYSARF